MYDTSLRMCMIDPEAPAHGKDNARAHGHTTRMRVATNRAGILLAIMRPGQLKTEIWSGVTYPLLTHRQ